MKNIKLKKALTALGAVMALGLAGQSMAGVSPYPDGLDPTADMNSFNADMVTFCAASQPFVAPDPTWGTTWDSGTANCTESMID